MKRRQHPEDCVQRAVCQHLQLRGVRGLLFCHAPNGGKRRPIEAAIMKSLGVRAGVADLVLVHAACMFALELKTEDGRPTAVQMHVCHQEAREPHGFEGAGIRSSYRTSTLRSRRMGARALLTT